MSETQKKNADIAFYERLSQMAERGDHIMARCEQLYGPRPEDGYTDEQFVRAERQLEDEGVISRG